jgi:enterochelin esterase-like enzyme
MKVLLYICLLLCPAITFAQQPAEHYAVDSASIVRPGVPKGEVLKFSFADSKIYPGTYRDYWVYIPAQYDGKKPACVFVDQDGIQFKTPTVFDNLINSKEMPVTIGIFITPGRVLAKDTTALDRYNRSYEYDALGDAYARFLLEELLPDVEKHKTTDGRPILLSKSSNDRAIGGTSSGAICAFTAAWERPDAFSRVYSGIGTYVGLRGGDRYPTLIRKYEPKPIRIFLQDGSHDQNIYAGDWFYANQMMERALTFAGYEVNHVYGEGTHSGAQSNAIFPDVMRWLWKGYPEPVKAGKSKNAMLGDILIPGEDWVEMFEGPYNFVGKSEHHIKWVLANLNAKPNGGISFENTHSEIVYEIYDDVASGSYSVNPMPIVRLRINEPFYKKYIKAAQTIEFTKYGETGKILKQTLFQGNDILKPATPNGLFYMAGANETPNAGKIFLVKKDYTKTIVDTGLNNPFGLALTPDHSQLYVTESNSHWVWIYNIKPDGTLTNKQHYGWLHVPDTAENAHPQGIRVDRDGRVYVATNMDIQVMDQTGRVNAILPLPMHTGQPIQLCFGGPNFDILYVSCGDKIFRRKLKIKGMNDFDTAVKPPKPHL